MLTEGVSNTELLAAATARTKQEKLHELGLTTADELSRAKVEETRILVRLAYPGTTEDMPGWAVALVQGFNDFKTQVTRDINSLRGDVRALGQQMTTLATRVTAVETKLGKIETKLIKIENRALVTDTAGRSLCQVPNDEGVLPSAADLPALTSVDDVLALSSDQLRAFLQFYGVRPGTSVEKNRGSLYVCLGIPNLR